MEPKLPIRSTPERMHRLYCQLTGMTIDFSMGRLFAWEAFCLKFTEQDLRDLVKFIKAKGQRGRSLLFRSLISGPGAIEFAEEDLAECRARRRLTPPTPRQEILRACGRPEPEAPAKSAAQILAGDKAFDEFKKWKESNL